MRKLCFELVVCLISLYLPANAGDGSEEVSKSLYSALASDSRLVRIAVSDSESRFVFVFAGLVV